MSGILNEIGVMASIILGMTGLITSVMTYFARGEGQSFWAAWVPIWAMVGLLVAPVGFTLFRVLGRLLDRALLDASEVLRMVLQGAIMALIMESFMAGATTFQIQGFGAELATVWRRALLAGLPIAAVMSVLGTFVIKPRMEAFIAS